MWVKYFPISIAESSKYPPMQNLNAKPHLLTLSMPAWVSQQCVKILQRSMSILNIHLYLTVIKKKGGLHLVSMIEKQINFRLQQKYIMPVPRRRIKNNLKP